MRQPSSFTFEGGALVFDAVLDSSAVHALELTEFPIEDGSSAADHAIRKPVQLSLTLCSTQSPIGLAPGFSVQSRELIVRSVSLGKQSTELKIAQKRGVQLNVAAAISTVGGALLSAASGATAIDGVKVEGATPRGFSIKALAADAPVDRVGEFYAELLRLQAAVTRLTLSFKGQSYPNLVLVSVTKTDSPNEFGRSKFPVELRELRTVVTRQVQLPAVPRAKKKKDLGAKPPATPAASEQQVRQSIADMAIFGRP